mmetsp:Transcript_114823/g.357655  ORF Transcript_114823/g.357655 Transcript_114823/m.357655 type:complete len:497 (-) Transcript_114823:97-1587(-)
MWQAGRPQQRSPRRGIRLRDLAPRHLAPRLGPDRHGGLHAAPGVAARRSAVAHREARQSGRRVPQRQGRPDLAVPRPAAAHPERLAAVPAAAPARGAGSRAGGPAAERHAGVGPHVQGGRLRRGGRGAHEPDLADGRRRGHRGEHCAGRQEADQPSTTRSGRGRLRVREHLQRYRVRGCRAGGRHRDHREPRGVAGPLAGPVGGVPVCILADRPLEAPEVGDPRVHGPPCRHGKLQVPALRLPRAGAEGHYHRACRRRVGGPGGARESVGERRDALVQLGLADGVRARRARRKRARLARQALGQGPRPVPRGQGAPVALLLDPALHLLHAGGGRREPHRAGGAQPRRLRPRRGQEERRRGAVQAAGCGERGLQAVRGLPLPGLSILLQHALLLAAGGGLRPPRQARAARRHAPVAHHLARRRPEDRGRAKHRGPVQEVQQPWHLHERHQLRAPSRGVCAGGQDVQERLLVDAAPGAVGAARVRQRRPLSGGSGQRG